MTNTKRPGRAVFGLRGLFLVVTVLAVSLGLGVAAGPIWGVVLVFGALLVYAVSRAGSRPGRRFSMWHVGLFLAVWLFAGILTFLALERNLTSSDGLPHLIALATASVSGPMTGAVSRGMQGCCLAASLSILPYSVCAVLLAVLAQFVIPPIKWYLRAGRLGLWLLGVLIWFGGGFVSLGHALS